MIQNFTKSKGVYEGLDGIADKKCHHFIFLTHYSLFVFFFVFLWLVVVVARRLVTTLDLDAGAVQLIVPSFIAPRYNPPSEQDPIVGGGAVALQDGLTLTVAVAMALVTTTQTTTHTQKTKNKKKTKKQKEKETKNKKNTEQ